jgi:hypothetical protein
MLVMLVMRVMLHQPCLNPTTLIFNHLFLFVPLHFNQCFACCRTETTGWQPLYKRYAQDCPKDLFERIVKLMQRIESDECPDFYSSPEVHRFFMGCAL